jgi:hypothetical protein
VIRLWKIQNLFLLFNGTSVKPVFLQGKTNFRIVAALMDMRQFNPAYPDGLTDALKRINQVLVVR